MDDEGTLVLYKYKDGEYKEIDRVSMNYDNGVENIIIGEGKQEKCDFYKFQCREPIQDNFIFLLLRMIELVNRISLKGKSFISISRW